MIAIIDVTGNNLTSLANAVGRLGYDYKLTHDARDIQQASHVILPGVGAAPSGMQALHQHHLIDVLTQLKQPLLGICLGMQLLLEYSEEGKTRCLGLIPGQAELIRHDVNYPIPHMGWNQVQWCNNSPLKKGLNEQSYLYFVHSYALNNPEHALALCHYNEPFSAIINKNNIYGMQFHPEKSAETGMILLKNFLSLETLC